MKKGWLILGGILVVALMVFMWSMKVRNQLIDADEASNKAWKDIATQLERRTDLIPNLVATVKGYAAHEAEIFTAVADARSRLLAAQAPAELAAADGAMRSALGRLMAISENYPQLKANESFIRLQDELAGTENRIAVVRQRYNESVKSFNAMIRKFPGSLFAGSLDLSKKEYYEPPADKALSEPPKVAF